jgi:murein DD-endopeptidase MepM/ murein hydrolase activator NlpD
MRYSKLGIITLFVFSLSFAVSSAQAQDLEIDNKDVMSDEFISYSRSFPVTSTVYPVVDRTSAITLPKMLWPTESKKISSGYGNRTPSCPECSANHQGVDFDPGRGSDVYAAMDGIISEIKYKASFGQYVYIDHVANINGEAFRWKTIYAHLEIKSTPKNIRIGQLIEAGTKIGTVGSTGTTTGPHLHFELIIEGTNVDPKKYLLMYAN